MKTYSARPTDITRMWYILDASELTLGRLSSKAAALLIGKGKPQVTAHIDCGDYVIVINAAQLNVTGNKRESKLYFHHSGYPSGLRQRTLAEQLQLDPAEIIRKAVRGMIPVNKLRDSRLVRLKVYADSQHHHEAQKPRLISGKEAV